MGTLLSAQRAYWFVHASLAWTPAYFWRTNMIPKHQEELCQNINDGGDGNGILKSSGNI